MIFPVLFFDKLIDPLCLNPFQIVLRAHAIIVSVSVVHAVDLPAGIPVTFKTKHDVTVCNIICPCAILEQVGAPLVPWPAADALASV